jgi:hypothetical protein
MCKKILLLLGLLLILGRPAWSQDAQPPTQPRGLQADILDSGRRTMVAERMREDERILLDGVLDEAVWQRAVPGADFIQQDPDNGGTPTERTEVRIAFDSERLYMGVLCFDSEPDRMLGNTMKRDEFLRADDRFMWTIDTFLNQQSGYFFEMNPSGLMADSLMGTGGGQDRAWDGIWDAQVLRTEMGWTIEISIPFRTLNFDPNAPAWGINFQRTIRRKNEENMWTGWQRNQGLRRMSNAGLLLGISDVSQGHGLDIKPYVATAAFDAPGADGSGPGDTASDVGVDLFYNLTPDLRANLTVNTDFAQTEVDQRLVNLTRFPLFFPEKRDFFLDGSTFFNFYLPRNNQSSVAVQPFFSRRIGLDADGVPQTIEVGAKLTGQVGAQDVGVLHVRTGAETDVVGENFTVLRARRRILAQSYVGSIYTHRDGRGGGSADNLQTAGVDFRLATSTFRESNNLELAGFALWNTTPLDTGESLAYGVQLDYPNDRWQGRVGFSEVQPNHNPAIGFTPRRGFRGYNPQFAFAPRPDRSAWLRQATFGLDTDLRTDMQNRLLTRIVDLTALGLSMESQDNMEFHVIASRERLEQDFEIHPGITLPGGLETSFTRYRFQVGTANRRVLATSSSVEVGSFFTGDREQLTVNLAVRPRPGVVVNLENEWNRVTLPEGRFQTSLVRLITDTQFSPWLYVVNNIQFDSVSERLGWQFRLRWIVEPGNDLFVVYTQNWRDDLLLDRFVTQDRRGAAKFVYTYRY